MLIKTSILRMLDKRLDRTEVSRWEQANAALLPLTATSD